MQCLHIIPIHLTLVHIGHLFLYKIFIFYNYWSILRIALLFISEIYFVSIKYAFSNTYMYTYVCVCIYTVWLPLCQRLYVKSIRIFQVFDKRSQCGVKKNRNWVRQGVKEKAQLESLAIESGKPNIAS